MTCKTEHTEQSITKLLMTNDLAVTRAILALYRFQTTEEQSAKDSKERNGVGFTKADSEIGTSMAKFALEAGFLTEKQIAYWRRFTGGNKCRICKYARQLLKIANSKRQ